MGLDDPRRRAGTGCKGLVSVQKGSDTSNHSTTSERTKRLRTVSLKATLRKLWHRGAVRILVVEDEEPLADAIARGLRREGMAVDIALNGDDGHEKATITRYDVVLLDRDLPGMSGDELCQEIVASGELTRVLMLTASGAVSDRVDGLSLGADDYLAKPFAFPELVARVRALGRRATPAAPPLLTAGAARRSAPARATSSWTRPSGPCGARAGRSS